MCISKLVGSESFFIDFSVFKYVTFFIMLFSNLFFSSLHSNLSYMSKTFSILGIVFGGCSALFSALFMTIFAVSVMFLFLGIAGIILGVMGRKQSIECYGKPTGIATAGFLVSIIGTAISSLFILSCLACASCVSALF